MIKNDNNNGDCFVFKVMYVKDIIRIIAIFEILAVKQVNIYPSLALGKCKC